MSARRYGLSTTAIHGIPRRRPDWAAAARFFAQTILPRLSAERAIAEGTDASIMDVPESAF